MMFGSFAYGTFHLTGLAHLAFCLSPTVFAGRLPRHTLSPDFWSRGFHRASGVGSEEARSIALALTSVRRSNHVCSFPAHGFHKDAVFCAVLEMGHRFRIGGSRLPQPGGRHSLQSASASIPSMNE
jgi:hypothetical protein